jgi:uroporphyrinogen decarboxylase
MKKDRTSRERVIHALRHEEADRVAIQDSPWATTVTRWRREGLPQNISPAEYFNYEFVRIGANLTFRFPHKLIEETDSYKIFIDANGRTLKSWKGRTSTPMLIDYTVKTRDDWEQHKHRLRPDRDRINWDVMERTCKQAREKGKFLCYSGGAGYQASTGKIHLENMLEAMVTDPEWIRDVIDTGVDMTLG